MGGKHKTQISNLTFRPAAYGIIIQKNKVLLSKQWDGYAFPGGGVSLGETIEEAVKREVREETGLDVKVGKIVSCQSSFFKLPHNLGCVQSILMFFLCSIIGGEVSVELFDVHEKKDADKPEWLKLSEIKNIKFKSTVDCLKILDEANQINKSA